MLKHWTELFAAHPWLEPIVEMILLIVGAWLIRRFGIAWLRRLARHTENTLDDAFVELANRALIPIFLLGILSAMLNLHELPPRLLAVCNRVLYVGVLVVALYYGSRAVRLFLVHWLARHPSGEAISGPAFLIARVAFAAFGIVIILDNLGISLTAVWTTLGVGSVAVALALQDTLSNVFAGFYVRLDNPVRVGDYVKLNSADEGFVTEIGWRSTRIRTLPNNTIVVPNSKLASAVITNYSLPEPQMSLLIPVSVSYAADPDFVERVLVEEAKRGAADIPGLLAEPEPFVRFIPGYGDSSLDFTLICRVNSFVDQYLAQHELRKRILRRFRREAIEIPFPQRDIHLFPSGSPGNPASLLQPGNQSPQG